MQIPRLAVPFEPAIHSGGQCYPGFHLTVIKRESHAISALGCGIAPDTCVSLPRNGRIATRANPDAADSMPNTVRTSSSLGLAPHGRRPRQRFGEKGRVWRPVAGVDARPTRLFITIGGPQAHPDRRGNPSAWDRPTPLLTMMELNNKADRGNAWIVALAVCQNSKAVGWPIANRPQLIKLPHSRE